MLTSLLEALSADSPNSALDNLSVVELQKHVNILASDVFQGRGTGQLGGELAAKYLAQEFDKIGLNPVGNNDTYYQYVQMIGSMPLQESRFKLYQDELEYDIELSKDYVLFKTGEQTYLPLPTEMVFAGYGIIAPEYDYNDYHGIDVDGKIVVCLGGEPLSSNPEFFDGNTNTAYSFAETKQRIAISRGAKGIIYIPMFEREYYSNWEQLSQSFAFEDITLAYSATGKLGVIMNPVSADILFRESGLSIDKLIQQHNNHSLSSFKLNTKMSFKGRFRERNFVGSNIIGLIQGSDPKLRERYIIISAHYDHLGIGPSVRGDSIYNGLLDNALGVAALLELARNFKSNPPDKSLIFLLTIGEEKGLLGSGYYADHPVVPLYRTEANINIDGISPYDRVRSFIGIGRELSSLGELFDSTAKIMQTGVSTIPEGFQNSDAFLYSDQVSFAKSGIPSILVLESIEFENLSQEEGLKRLIKYSNEQYHKPFDDLSIPINYEAALQHIQFIYVLINLISNSPESPRWNKESPFAPIWLRNKAEKR